MNQKLQKIITEVQQRFKLENYTLSTWSIFHEKRSLAQANYILSMEWFPNETDNNLKDDDLNPSGTAIIDINFHSGVLYQIVFVNGMSNKNAKDIFPSPKSTNVTQWVEEVTGLIMDKNFMLTSAENNKYHFQATINNLPVIPLGTIQVEFNNQDELILFSLDGVFPDETDIAQEPFTLTIENISHLFKQQLKLFELPVVDNSRWMPVYIIDELFVNNSDMTTFQDPTEHDKQLDLTLSWSTQLESSTEPLARIDLSTEVTFEQALENKPHPDNKLVTPTEKETVITKTRNFLRHEYPLDSDKWFLHKIYREHGYLTAELKLITEAQRVIRRKLKIMMDPSNYDVINFVDNQTFIDMFDDYKEAEKIKIASDDAFEKLKNKLNLSPVYVGQSHNNSYALYGQIGSEYGVLATTGEVINLNEL